MNRYATLALIASTLLTAGCMTTSSYTSSGKAVTQPAQSQDPKLALAGRLTDYQSLLSSDSRYPVDMLVDVESVLGRPRNLTGVHVVSYAGVVEARADIIPAMVDLPRGTIVSRRYAIKDGLDLLVTYCDATKAIEHGRSTTTYALRNASTAESALRFCDKVNDVIARIAAGQQRCVAMGRPDHVVTMFGATYVQMNADEQRAAWMEEGENWAKNGNWADAARCFESAAGVEPASEQALWKAAVAHAGAGNKQAAQAALKRFRGAATQEQLAQAASQIGEVELRIVSLPY